MILRADPDSQVWT